jgi:hypothetical protein
VIASLPRTGLSIRCRTTFIAQLHLSLRNSLRLNSIASIVIYFATMICRRTISSRGFSAPKSVVSSSPCVRYSKRGLPSRRWSIPAAFHWDVSAVPVEPFLSSSELPLLRCADCYRPYRIPGHRVTIRRRRSEKCRA